MDVQTVPNYSPFVKQQTSYGAFGYHGQAE